MNTWAKIKSNIYQEKLDKVEDLFSSLKLRSEWTTKLQSWAYSQRVDKYNSLGLSLTEYNEVIGKIQENVYFNFKDKDLLNSLKEDFKIYYKFLLEQKEEELKLEVVSELIEEKKVPLDIFVEWYLDNKNLPPEQFQEALGEFWGDVWKHAKRGASTGALGGAAAGALGTGGLGTFAGAGLGSLAGGIGGGIYGAGKHLLRKVWDWRRNQTEFEKTKKDAYDILKKLKNDSSQFELHPNFHRLLDAMIQKLGVTKAYQLSTPRPMGPMLQLQPQTEPQKPVLTGNNFQVSGPGGGNPTDVAPPVATHQSDTGAIPGQHVADVGVGMHDLPGSAEPAKKKRNRKTAEIEPKPTAVDTEEEKPVGSKEDVLNYLSKPGLDEKELNSRLVKLGLALNMVGDPQDKDEYNSIDFDLLRHGLMHDVSNMPNEEKEHYREKALAYQNFLAKREPEQEVKPIPDQPKQYVPDEDPANMPVERFKEFLKAKGMWQPDMKDKQLGKAGGDRRLQFIADNGVSESIASKYINLLKKDARPVFVEHKIGSLNFQDRIEFYKAALRGSL